MFYLLKTKNLYIIHAIIDQFWPEDNKEKVKKIILKENNYLQLNIRNSQKKKYATFSIIFAEDTKGKVFINLSEISEIFKKYNGRSIYGTSYMDLNF